MVPGVESRCQYFISPCALVQVLDTIAVNNQKMSTLVYAALYMGRHQIEEQFDLEILHSFPPVTVAKQNISMNVWNTNETSLCSPKNPHMHRPIDVQLVL